MSVPLDQLVRLAKGVQAAVVARWPEEASPLPARRYITVGASATTVYDAEQFTVSTARAFGHSGDISQETWTPRGVGLWAQRAVSLDLTVARKWPIGTTTGRAQLPPTPDEIESATEMILTDGRALENALLQAIDEDPFLAVPGGRQIAFESWQPIGPSGDMAGGMLTVRLQVL